MPLAVNTTLPVVTVQGSGAPVALQPGAVVSARVLHVADSGQVQINIGGQALTVRSEVPLQPGQTLQLSVSQTADGVRLAVVPQQAATANPAQLAAAMLSGDAVLREAALAAKGINLASLASQLPAPTVALSSALTLPETVVVSTAAQAAAARQGSLAQLFANLDAIDLSTLPPQLQAAVTQLKAQRPALTAALSAADLKQAFQASGLFMEATLASGTSAATVATDLKAALMQLRQALTSTLATAGNVGGAATNAQAAALSTVSVDELIAQLTQAKANGTTSTATTTTTGSAVNTVASPTIAPTLAETSQAKVTQQVVAALTEDGAAFQNAAQPASTAATARTESGALLTALQEALQANPQIAGQTAKLLPGSAALLSLVHLVSGGRMPVRSDDEIAMQRHPPPPPIRGALPSVQPVVQATLDLHSPLHETSRQLLADTEAALARQTLLQVASLPDRADAGSARADGSNARWAFEIPFVTPQGTAVAQFEISRDGTAQETDAAKRVWRARFTLDVEPAGPVHALVTLTGEDIAVKMWAERPATAAQMRAESGLLGQALSRAQLHPSEIVVREGAPNEPAPPSAGYFLDRAL
ncbi:flagellar hook-length control protein FliK [Rhodopseudomonas faecalis]|uniref:Flagellar hook-length control protein FliK n=1 Tax=Rhodopseudomonas faecalis TaxID=99655 RepID=A0A318TF71_9BRAD|nr:flagellar hook-length control protein FliK [Rhodopseudomonas faecalis]